MAVSQAAARTRSRLARTWFALLLGAICFEGLGRKLLPEAPSSVFYFLKDVVLLLGLLAFGVRREVARTASALLGVFSLALAAAVGWTVVQVFNPSQAHLGLAIIGLRSYWLWWLAPLVIASALSDTGARRAATNVLVAIHLVVVGYAAYQFAVPPDSAVNAYAPYEGEEIMPVAVVGTTGRARVASTFAYLSGFTDFLVLAPPLLLALGLTEGRARMRALAVVTAAAAAAAIPMSGSRAPLALAAMGLGLVGWGAGALATRAGRGVLAGGMLAVGIAAVALPVAVEGVRDRFRGPDTPARVAELLQTLPPVALTVNDFPLLGDGTGMQQNARRAFGVPNPWNTEGETSRLLVELGPLGYLLVWSTKLGLAVALLRASRTLRRSGRRAMAGAALAYAFFAIVGNSAFDHVWQALFFVGVGLLVHATTEARSAEA